MTTMNRMMMAAAVLAAPVLALAARAEADAAPPPTVHEVKMVMEGTTARFEPAALTVRPGDRVRFVTVSGGPHNVAFDADRINDAAEGPLGAGMPGEKMGPLAGPLVIQSGQSWTMSFAGVPAGRYEYFCMPHAGMDMKGVITVQG